MGVFSVPVTIGVNEEEIAKRIEENVEKQVIDSIIKETKKIMFSNQSYFDSGEPLRRMVIDCINKVVSERQDEIVKLAAEILAEKLARTKAVKEAAAKKIEEAM